MEHSSTSFIRLVNVEKQTEGAKEKEKRDVQIINSHNYNNHPSNKRNKQMCECENVQDFWLMSREDAICLCKMLMQRYLFFLIFFSSFPLSSIAFECCLTEKIMIAMQRQSFNLVHFMNRENAFDAIWISAYMKPHKTINSEEKNYEKRHTKNKIYIWNNSINICFTHNSIHSRSPN